MYRLHGGLDKTGQILRAGSRVVPACPASAGGQHNGQVGIAPADPLQLLPVGQNPRDIHPIVPYLSKGNVQMCQPFGLRVCDQMQPLVGAITRKYNILCHTIAPDMHPNRNSLSHLMPGRKKQYTKKRCLPLLC